MYWRVQAKGIVAYVVYSARSSDKVLKGPVSSQPSGPIENTLCAYETIETLNKDLYPTLHDLVTSDFFRHYKVDLFRECPFWYENGFCMNRDCGVETADEVSLWRYTTGSDHYAHTPHLAGPYTRKMENQGIEPSSCDRRPGCE
jgi:hypothetical protein